MDVQDHGKTHIPSGHEGHGVHLCHRCGWPFPNPHPSARHRRAHKKICGTIEGYTNLIDSGVVSDDEHHSDQEKQETPSSDAGKKTSIKESGSGAVGNGERSNRSEDDLFSDAVTEFSDSGISPGLEERLVGKGDLDKALYRDSFQSFKDADATDVVSSPIEITKVDNLAITETLVSELVQDTHAKDVEKVEERDVTSECISAEGKMKLLETDEETSNPLVKDGTPGESDRPQKVQSIDLSEASADRIQTKSDPATNVDVSSGKIDMIEVSDKKEQGEETVNVLSVASDIPKVDQSESLHEDCEDHGAVTPNVPVVPGSGSDKDTADKIISSAEATSVVHIFEEKTGGEKIQEIQASEDDQSKVEFTTDCGHTKTSLSASTPAVPTEEAKVAESQPLELSEITPGSLDSIVEAEVPPVDSLPEEDSKGKQEELMDKLSDLAASERTDAASLGGISEDIKKEKLAESQPLELSEITPGSLDNIVEAEVPPVDSLPEEDSKGKQEELMDKLSDLAASERIDAASLGGIIGDIKKEKLESCDKGTPEVGKEPEIDHSLPVLTEKEDASAPNLETCSKECTAEVVKVFEIDNDSEVVAQSVKADSEDGVDVVMLEKSSEKLNYREAEKLPNDSEPASENSATMKDIHNINNDKNATVAVSEPMIEESNGKLMTNQDCAVDMSVDSSSHNSLEGNWGSVSVLSTASVDAETTHSNDKSKINSEKLGIAEDGRESSKSDAFEAPSFMTLVEPKGEVVDKKAAAASTEIETVQNSKQKKERETNVTNVSNESEERKRNEEVIAKVTNWSTGKHSTPLKNLLGEAKSPNPKHLSTVVQKDEAEERNNGNVAATEKSSLIPEAPTVNQEMSPPKYIGEGKKDRKKVKGRASWLPFVCCSSVNVS